MKRSVGSPPLGAHWDGRGVHFALRAPDATAVRLCLFDDPESAVARREVELTRNWEGIFRTRIEGLGPGTLYGYRVEGPWTPREGLRFDPNKLLIDPYARAITGEPRRGSFPMESGEGEGLVPFPGNGDTAGHMPKCVVIDPAFDWQGVRRPEVPWPETVVYECHVKGMTQLHPDVDKAHRGTYLGLTSPAVLEHWRRLGVTSIELLPVQQIASEVHLLIHGRSNYWGYSTLGFFAPHAGYRSGGSDTLSTSLQVVEFKTMVRELHRAGFEVLMDVVFNHTAEGNALGPTWSLRGIDNRGTYRLREAEQDQYIDFTGCGNSLDVRQPAVQELILDCLRYWAGEMQVDGFRFDLATVLGREPEVFSPEATLFRRIAEDPLLSTLKWIAEPWDLGPDGYRLGQFPEGWRQWNDLYRLDVRRFWRGDGAGAAQLARRLTGSDDVFGHRETTDSLNYVVSHDGFTLQDLVSYGEKHNEANGEDNRDGSNDDSSCNWGREGPTEDTAIQALRRRTRRNLLATLAFSKGTPMLAQGDEMGHSQGGNNNPYCQDNSTTWLDWSLSESEDGTSLRSFVQYIFQLRRRFPVLRSLCFLRHEEVVWRLPNGRVPENGDWENGDGRSLSLQWLGGASESSERLDGAGDLLLLIHAGSDPQTFHLPPGDWHLWLDTADESMRRKPSPVLHQERRLGAYSLCLLSS